MPLKVQCKQCGLSDHRVGGVCCTRLPLGLLFAGAIRQWVSE